MSESLLVSQIDEVLKTLRNKRLVTTDEVVDKLLDLRALAELQDAVQAVTTVVDVTETDVL